MAAAKNGYADVVKLLIDRGADVCLKAGSMDNSKRNGWHRSRC